MEPQQITINLSELSLNSIEVVAEGFKLHRKIIQQQSQELADVKKELEATKKELADLKAPKPKDTPQKPAA